MTKHRKKKNTKISKKRKKKKYINYAFIDSQNVNLSIRDQGWALDVRKFRRYLKDKYSITKYIKV